MCTLLMCKPKCFVVQCIVWCFLFFFTGFESALVKWGDNVEREAKSQCEAVNFEFGVCRGIGPRETANETDVSFTLSNSILLSAQNFTARFLYDYIIYFFYFLCLPYVWFDVFLGFCPTSDQKLLKSIKSLI